MVTAGTRRRCAVLGSPVAHSLSPVLHRAAYRALGLDWEYDAVDVRADALAGFLDGLDPAWRGLSLTMPLKRAALPLLDSVTDTATAAGGANTVLLDDDGSRRGHNTDVTGMRRALQEHGCTHVRDAVVVGGGATAASAVVALTAMGCRSLTLWVREPQRAREVVEAARRLPDPPRVGVRRLDERLDVHPVDVLVSTVPAPAQTTLADTPLLEVLERAGVVFDVVYAPWPTPLARAATSAGRRLVGGLDLLVHQATRQVELMTGCEAAPLDAMRAAGREALARAGADG